jgi:hypothetical protein
MARRARINVVLVEHGDEITVHFEDRRLPPLWFTNRDHPVAFSELKRALDDARTVEEIPVIGSIRFDRTASPGDESRSA